MSTIVTMPNRKSRTSRARCAPATVTALPSAADLKDIITRREQAEQAQYEADMVVAQHEAQLRLMVDRMIRTAQALDARGAAKTVDRQICTLRSALARAHALAPEAAVADGGAR